MENIPSTLDESVIELHKTVPSEKLAEVKNGNLDMLSLHHSLGQSIRNTWGLWAGSELRDMFFELGLWHADDMSAIILKKFQCEVREEEFNLDTEVQHYKNFWEKQNINCELEISKIKNRA